MIDHMDEQNIHLCLVISLIIIATIIGLLTSNNNKDQP